MIERVETVLHRARGDDVVIALGRRIDIVVVIIEPRFGEHIGLFGRQHPQRHAGFHAHGAHRFHDLDNCGHVAILGVAPGSPHAKSLRACIGGLRCLLEDLLHFHQLGGLDAAVGLHRLAAITAIFRAAAGLDAEQGT